MKTSILLAIALLYGCLIQAQHTHTHSCNHEHCLTDRMHQHRLQTDSAYREHFEAMEQEIRHIQEQHRHNRLQSNVYTIPVVVHVVHLGEALGAGSNITDAQIVGAIQGMNNSFRNMNGIGVDMEIEFCLASRDPNGNATTGINRVNGSVVPNYSTNGISNSFYPVSSYPQCANEQSVKDLSKWPIRDYLNIWVVPQICAPSSFISGIATLQTGSPYDGVSIIASRMRRTDSLYITHEVGHMFGLLHTFNGNTTTTPSVGCPLDASCEDQGDRVCDTPPHRQSDFGATNPCAASGTWDNARCNIMHYGWISSPATITRTDTRFTQGQKDRARAALFASGVANYINSMGCVPPSPNDAAIETIKYPIKSTYSTDCTFPNNGIAPVVKLRNYGTNPLTNATIYYKLDNGSLNTMVWNGNLATNATTYVNLPAISVAQGAHTLLVYSGLPNGAADGYARNDSANAFFNYQAPLEPTFDLTTATTPSICNNSLDGSASVIVANSAPHIVIKEDWENITDWTILNGSQTNRWVVGTAVANGGSKSIYISNDGGTSNVYNDLMSSKVYFYKDFYFPANATNLKIKFDWKGQGLNVAGQNGLDRLRVYLIDTDSTPQPNSSYDLDLTEPYLGSYYYQATYRTDSIIGIDANAGQSKRLVFSWYNMRTGIGTQTPASVDNIIVSYDLPATTYSYAWNTTPTQNTANATALSANTYQVTVTNNTSHCTSVTNVVVNATNTSSTAPSITPLLPNYCPNTTITLNAAGGTTGTGAQIKWYDTPNGGGTLLGTGNSITVSPNSTTTYYARREGLCNASADATQTATIRTFAYANNNTISSGYCTDNSGWNHFYNGNEIILSLQGDLSMVTNMTATIHTNPIYYDNNSNPALCMGGGAGAAQKFELPRNWNIDYIGSLNGLYKVRFYYPNAERTAVETAASNWITANLGCGYSYQYNTLPNGWFWFKNVGTTYVAPQYDGLHLTETTTNSTFNGIHYSDIDGISSFSGGSGGIILVPSTLLSVHNLEFNGHLRDKPIVLNWITNREENLSYFDVERSSDGLSNFENLGQIAAQGNNDQANYYQFVDEYPLAGINYYRLRQVSLDGQVTYSAIIAIEAPSAAHQYSIYPNPTTGQLNCEFYAEQSDELVLELTDVLGQVLEQREIPISEGSQRLSVDLSSYPNGNYLLHLYCKKSTNAHTQKIIKAGF